jgi:hypothetical protein
MLLKFLIHNLRAYVTSPGYRAYNRKVLSEWRYRSISALLVFLLLKNYELMFNEILLESFLVTLFFVLGTPSRGVGF